MSGIDQPPPSPQDPPAAAPANPWLGLASYTEHDRGLFYGRDREKAELLRLVERESLTVLFGRSGLGKTSLLRAGVIPALREKAYFPLVLRIDYSGKGLSPVEQVKALLQEAAKTNEVDLENLPGEGATFWEYFHAVECWGPRNDQLTPILVFDQFEEVFTIGGGQPTTSEFLNQLADLVENRPPRTLQERIEQTHQPLSLSAASRNYKIVLSLREDYVSKLDSLRPLMPAIMRNRMGLDPLDGERALSVIVQAGKEWVGEDVARDIVAAVAGRAHDGDNLPTYRPQAEIEPAYLSVMCHELFRRMLALERNAIARDLVEHEHGGILERLYERSFEGLDPNVRTFVEDKLVSAAGFRMAVPLAESISEGISDKDLDLVVDRRLLRFDDRLGTRYVELSHDLLTRVVQKSRDERRAANLRRALLRSRVRAAAAGALASLLLGVLLLVYFGYFHEFIIYGSDFRKRFGMEEPLGTISWEAVKHREWSLKFVRKGFKPFRGEVISVFAIDSTGHLTERHGVSTYLKSASDDSDRRRNKECQWQLVYDHDGHVTYEIARDRFDRMVWGFVYSPDIHVGGQSDTRKAMFVGPDGYPQPQRKSSAEYVEITYAKNGSEIKFRFSDREGNPAPGPDGAFGRSYEYDPLGRVTRLTSLDKAGQPMNDNAGNATLILKYDSQGNQNSATALDRHGHFTLFKSGYAKSTHSFDRWGNLTETRLFGLHDQPAVDADVGAEVIRYQYDDRGNEVEVSYFDRHGDPVESLAAKAHAIHVEHDNQNRPISRRFFDTAMRAALGTGGFHQVQYSYDSRGFVKEERYLDERGHPAKIPQFRYILVNDEFGRPKEERTYKADGGPVPFPSETYSIRRNRYDERGNSIEQTFSDADGKPAMEAESGVHKVVHEFDRFSNTTAEAYFGPDDVTPVTNRSGYHRVEASYDSFGNPTGTAYFDIAGHSVALNGVHEERITFDDRGLPLKKGNFGTDGRPVNDKFGIFRSEFEYNDKQQRTRLEFFDLNGQPAANGEGIHQELQEYDDLGHKTRVTHTRNNGSGFLFETPGVATVRQKFDDEGRWTEQSYYDVNDKLVIGPYGFAKGTVVYGEDGTSEHSFFGPDGSMLFDGLYGCARWRKNYVGDRLVRFAYYSADGSLINGPEGFAIQTVEGNVSGEGEIERFLDQDQKPAYGSKGYSERRSRKRGDKTENIYFDRNNQLLPHPEDGVPVLYISSIDTTNSVATKIGLLAGDVLWRLGDWSLPATLELARTNLKQGERIDGFVDEAFREARATTKKGPSRIEVVRNGKVIRLAVPLIPDGAFGVEVDVRLLPAASYQQTFGPLVASAARD